MSHRVWHVGFTSRNLKSSSDLRLCTGGWAMKWYLAQMAIGEPEINVREDEEDLTLGFSLIRALAESDDTLLEVAPNVWRHSWLVRGDVGNSGPAWPPPTS